MVILMDYSTLSKQSFRWFASFYAIKISTILLFSKMKKAVTIEVASGVQDRQS
jgi:hypothetical protein